MVEIVVPIYKQNLSEDDLLSIRQLFKVLGNYSIVFVHPESLDLDFYREFKASFIAFDDRYFKGIEGYNRLLMNPKFYQKFTAKYILIYQTDCYVFKDELKYWCSKNYDYIGAPWIRSKDKIPFFKLIIDQSVAKMKAVINFKGNGRIQKDKSLIYNQVGNGGFSLRKREKFIEILQQLPDVVKVYLNPKNQSTFYAEDVFFSIEPKRNKIDFSKPDYIEACKFSMENKPQKALEFNKGELPFGCHRWNKENREFWNNFFLTDNN